MKSNYLELLKQDLLDLRNISGSELYYLDQVRQTPATKLLKVADRLLGRWNFRVLKQRGTAYERRVNGEDWPSKALTMIGQKRLNNIEYCLREIKRDQIAGDLCECGVWRGGAAIFMKAFLKESGMEDRKIWLADSFEGMPAPDASAFPPDASSVLHKEPILKVSLDAVKRNFQSFSLLDDQVRFIKGWFKDTLPASPISRLALLRVDADLFQSTTEALTFLYPRLSEGGYVIIDDYNAFSFCRKAVDRYRQAHGITEEITEIDREAVFWRKSPVDHL